MADVRITKRVVDGAEPGAVDRTIWDAELGGFGLRVRPSGAKTYVARYRAGTGRSAPIRRFTIGPANRLSPDEARTAARKVIGAAAQGEDPAATRAAKSREMTVADLVDLWDVEGSARLKDLTKRYTLARLKHHVVPLLGRRKVTEVRVADVERLVRDVRAGKTAKDEKGGPRRRVIVRGGPGAAAKAVRDLSVVLSFAKRRELIAANPCEAAEKPTEGRRDRYLTLEEVRRLGKALDKLEAEGANPKAAAIIRLWVLTGCRRDEIAALRWEEVDAPRACLRLADSKTGRSVRPLAAPALAVLAAVPREVDAETQPKPFVFPAVSGGGFYQGTKRVWAQLVKVAKLAGVTPHTLRHTLGSAAVSSGETLAMTGALLGHANARSTGIYAHMQHDSARQAAERTVGPLAVALAGGPPAPPKPTKKAPNAASPATADIERAGATRASRSKGSMTGARRSAPSSARRRLGTVPGG